MTVSFLYFVIARAMLSRPKQSHNLVRGLLHRNEQERGSQ